MSDITQRLKAQHHEQSQLIQQISKLEYELAIRKSRNKKLFKIVNRYYTLQQIRLLMETDVGNELGLGSDGRLVSDGRLGFGEGRMMNVADRHLQYEDTRRQYQQRQWHQQVTATPVVSPGNSSMGSPREDNVRISSSSLSPSCKRQRYR